MFTVFSVDSRVFQWNPLHFWAMGTTTAELAEWGQNRDVIQIQRFVLFNNKTQKCRFKKFVSQLNVHI